MCMIAALPYYILRPTPGRTRIGFLTRVSVLFSKKKIYTHPRLSPYRGATTAAWAWGVAHIDSCGMRTCAAGYTAGIHRPAPGVNGHGAGPCSIQHRQVNFYTSKAKRPLQALCVRASEAKRLYLTGNPQRTQVPVRVNRLCNGRGRQPLIFATTT